MKNIFLSFMALALLVAPKTFAQSAHETICSGGKGDDFMKVTEHELFGIEVQKYNSFYNFPRSSITHSENGVTAIVDEMERTVERETFIDTNVRLEMKYYESTRNNGTFLIIEELSMNGQNKSPKDVRILKCK